MRCLNVWLVKWWTKRLNQILKNKMKGKKMQRRRLLSKRYMKESLMVILFSCTFVRHKKIIIKANHVHKDSVQHNGSPFLPKIKIHID